MTTKRTLKDDIQFISVSNEKIDIIKPLWEKLKIHHQKVSLHFPEKYQKADFEHRKKEILSKSEKG